MLWVMTSDVVRRASACFPEKRSCNQCCHYPYILTQLKAGQAHSTATAQEVTACQSSRRCCSRISMVAIHALASLSKPCMHFSSASELMKYDRAKGE